LAYNYQTDSSISQTTLFSRSTVDTMTIGQQLAQVFESGMVCALFGNLGSGKTVLVKGVCRGLGVQEEVTSPSFMIMNIYNGRCPIYHFDFYRLQRKTNWADLGLDEYLFADGLSLIEWPDRLKDDLPESSVHIFIRRIHPVSAVTENQRLITVVGLKLAAVSLSQFTEEQQIG